MRDIVFLTGTRADYGKLKSLMTAVDSDEHLNLHIFITGMHMLSKYGKTFVEIERDRYSANIVKSINQSPEDTHPTILAKTVALFNDFVREVSPDLIVIHGDRVEALAGAIVGSLSNILTAHIEGGELSGTIDDTIRHAVSKLSHIHFIANEDASQRLIQLGENPSHIHLIGSPDIDIMMSNNLPSLKDSLEHYELSHLSDYAISIYHPVTTELDSLEYQAAQYFDALADSNHDYICIYPNNDPGSNIVFNQLSKFSSSSDKFHIFPSLRFEHFLTLLKHAKFIIGNSSAGIREAPFYGVPAINVGSRQNQRLSRDIRPEPLVQKSSILSAILKLDNPIESTEDHHQFGEGRSTSLFMNIINTSTMWDTPIQKVFNDRT